MQTPTLSGIHHPKIPVSDIEQTAAWFEKTLLARRIPRFDHKDENGTLYAAMMMLPGVDKPLELRHAPRAAKAIAGYDPVTFQVDKKEDLDVWAKQLDAAGWQHSGVIQGYIGHLIEMKTPDRLEIGFYTKPEGDSSMLSLRKTELTSTIPRWTLTS